MVHDVATGHDYRRFVVPEFAEFPVVAAIGFMVVRLDIGNSDSHRLLPVGSALHRQA
jgi:hypothetical protein